MNLAIFNRSLKQFGESLMMWKRLEQLQKFLYGDDNYMLLYTLKNIGTCYLGIGQSDTARKYFLDCISLIQNAKSDTVKEDLIVKDKEEIAQLNQNIYLTYVSDRKYIEAIESSEKAIEIIAEIYGSRSKRLSSKLY